MANLATSLLGKTYGYLTVVARAGTTENIASQCALWLCHCVCGKQVVRRSQYLRAKHRKHPRSCGCHHGNEKHKLSSSRTYRSWSAMRRRCLNTLDKDWRNYGGRGITVCEAWQTTFQPFLDDMGIRPAGKTLGRIDNQRGYCKANCRWESAAEQGQNTRQNRIIQTPAGLLTITKAATTYGIKKGTLFARLNRGWDVAKAISAPVSMT